MPAQELDRRTLVLLGLPALGLTLGVTVVSTYLPVALGVASSPVVIGLLLGLEGVFALLLPPLVGAWSDRHARRVGDRLRLCLLAGGLMAAALLALAASTSLAVVAVALALLYTGYFTYLAPYWALFPTLVPPAQAGRAGAAEGSWRLLGSAAALIGGGLLYALGGWVPFVATAAVLAVSVLVFDRGMAARVQDVPLQGAGPAAEAFAGRMVGLLRDASVRRVLVANALWNAALSVIRVFVVLYVVEGLGGSTELVSTVVFPLAALGFVVAPFAGTLADRVGLLPVVTTGLVLYAAGTAIPLVTAGPAALAVVPVVAAGAATVMTLPLALLVRLLPPSDHGVASGAFGASRGLGSALGPLLAGAAIVVLRPAFPGTDGYAAMWLVTSLLLLASVPLVLRLRADARLRTPGPAGGGGAGAHGEAPVAGGDGGLDEPAR